MTTTRPLIPRYDAQSYTDDDGLRRYHNSGGDYVTFKNLQTGRLFAISETVWAALGNDIKKIPAEWRSLKDELVSS